MQFNFSNQFLINGSIEKKDIESSLNKFMINEKDTYSKKNVEYIIKTPKKSVIPRSEKQKNYKSTERVRYNHFSGTSRYW